jgi:hypothetical protein
MMEALCSCVTWISIYQSTWHSMSQDSHRHIRRREDMRAHIMQLDRMEELRNFKANCTLSLNLKVNELGPTDERVTQFLLCLVI